MKITSDQELFYAAVVSRSLIGNKLFLKYPDGFSPILKSIYSGGIQYNELTGIIEGLFRCAKIQPNGVKHIGFNNLNIQRKENNIFMDFSVPSDTTIISIPAMQLELLATQLQYFVDLSQEMKVKGITIENGFYFYWYKQGVNLSSLNRIFLHLISRNHQLRYFEVTDCWNLIRNDLIFNEEFSFEMFEEMVNALGESTAILDRFDREDKTKDASTDGKKYYQSLFGGRGGNSYGWDITNEGTFSVYCLGSDYGSKTLYCPLEKIRVELEGLLLRFYFIVDRERQMLQ